MSKIPKKTESARQWAVRNAASHAASAVTLVNYRSLLDEEFITGALLGAISSAYPIFAALSGAKPGQDTGLYWGQFRKSVSVSKGSARDAESKSGADFALVLCADENEYRMALFQAKREDNNGRMNVHYKSDAQKKLAEGKSQMALLRDKGVETMCEFHPSSPSWDTDNLFWVHYLAYVKGGILGVPFSQLVAEYIKERNGNSKDNLVQVSKRSGYPVPRPSVAFGQLVRDGFAPRSSPRSVGVNGWLCIDYQQGVDHLPRLIETTSVYFVDRKIKGKILSLSLARNGYDSVQQIEAVHLELCPNPEPGSDRGPDNESGSGPDFPSNPDSGPDTDPNVAGWSAADMRVDHGTGADSPPVEDLQHDRGSSSRPTPGRGRGGRSRR